MACPVIDTQARMLGAVVMSAMRRPPAKADSH
jgi:hypothetical protein